MNTTTALGSEPAITNAPDKVCILQDPAVAAMLHEMIQESIEQGLARTKAVAEAVLEYSDMLEKCSHM